MHSKKYGEDSGLFSNELEFVMVGCPDIMFSFLTEKETDMNEESSSSDQSTGRGRRASTREIQRHRVRPIKVEESDDEEIEEGGVRILNLGENCRLPHKQTFIPTWDGMFCTCHLARSFDCFPSQFVSQSLPLFLFRGSPERR